MSSEVGHHVALLREAFATDVTGIRLFLRVDTALVCLQVPSLREALRTVPAVVVLFPGVDLHVSVHVPLLSEAFAADL